MTAAPPPPDDLSLAGSFAPAGIDQWRGLVAAALRKSGRIHADDDPDVVERVLTRTTYDGIAVRPLYTRADAVGDDEIGVPGLAPFVRGSTTSGAVPAGWDVRSHHLDPDVEVTHEAVMTDLENGAASLWLTVGSGGLPPGSLARVLDGVMLDLAPVVLDAGTDTEVVAGEFLELLALLGDRPCAGGSLGADPIGLRARLGRGYGPDLTLLPRLAHRTGRIARSGGAGTGLRVATIDATVHHDAGASDAQELGASLATGVAYLRALTDGGMGTAEAFGQLEFRYAAHADQFLTIAKFRAARRLWARVAEVCGLAREAADPATAALVGQRQHAVTSSVMMTRRDPWVNMLRTTLAAFGAGVGGADAVTVQHFDAAIGLPDAFSRRIARNTSSLLVMESHLARVIDPAGGSWYVEQLTQDLARAGWEQFTAIEAEGGMLAALESGRFAGRVEATWAERAKQLAVRTDPLTGVSEFPDLAEVPVVRRPLPAPAARGEGALPVHRHAEQYEALRDAAESAPVPPVVFLATIGPVSAHTARATFAAGLFQAGGLATSSGGPGTDPVAIAAAFTASGARVACLASSDQLYADHAEPVAAALRAAGAQYVLLAGGPGERAGIDGYVYRGVDVPAVLRDLHRRIGIGS